jgi:hypothetical protein
LNNIIFAPNDVNIIEFNEFPSAKEARTGFLNSFINIGELISLYIYI